MAVVISSARFMFQAQPSNLLLWLKPSLCTYRISRLECILAAIHAIFKEIYDTVRLVDKLGDPGLIPVAFADAQKVEHDSLHNEQALRPSTMPLLVTSRVKDPDEVKQGFL